MVIILGSMLIMFALTALVGPVPAMCAMLGALLFELIREGTV